MVPVCYPSKPLFHSLSVNEIISLDNLAGYGLDWLLALYHVSLLLPDTGTYIWVYMALIDWHYCFGHQMATGAGGGQRLAAPTCPGHRSGDGCPLQQAEPGAACVCPIFFHQSLLLVLVTCFLRSFVPSHLPKSQPTVSICFCVSPSCLTAGI